MELSPWIGLLGGVAGLVTAIAAGVSHWLRYKADSRGQVLAHQDRARDRAGSDFLVGVQKAEELHAQYEERARQMETSHEDRVRVLEASYEAKITQLEAHYEDKLRSFRDESEQEIEMLRAEIDALTLRLAPHERIGIAILSVDMVYLHINEVAAKLNHPDATPEDHVGRHVKERWPDLWPEAEPYLRQAMEGGAWEGIIVANMSGLQRRFRVSYQPIKWRAKRVTIGLLALFTLLDDMEVSL